MEQEMFKTAILASTLLLLPVTPAAASQQAILNTSDTTMQGIEQSMYQGKWYSSAAERARRCIIKRESHANYRARNSSGHAGAYQFNDAAWRVSLTWMLLREFKDHRFELLTLRKKPINAWPRHWQDAAWFTAWRHGRGAQHWYLYGSACNNLVVVR